LGALRQLKKLDKILSSFATEALAKQEIIHTHFNVHGTASGRLSSSDPNLQQIPGGARFLYVPLSEGWEFLEVDYSGIENRLTAYLADDTDRLRKFNTIPGYSEHKHAVEVFFGIPYADVEKDNDKDAPYGKAKRIVHGTNYGMGARKIANTFDMDEAEVKILIAKWKSAIVKTTLWQEATAAQAKREGYLTTPFGRKRWFYTDSYYTESLSFIPQSTAADVIFAAMVGLYFERINLAPESARLVSPYIEALPRPALLHLQVHDSLIFSYPAPMRDEIVGVVARVTQQPWPQLGGFSIPIEAKVGASWGELKEYHIN
jgi:DNA polymerase-1